ncbi:MAG: SDR family oxidoreductase [Ancrocorticia sp.]|jgi:NADP-dependent 3-hydroxy acid dehydrogenase YdfG|nr:SDR family oxidoreductase [Ancrocorticia sp.]MCI1895425.1 SDR family oxidoreductase [Ancrocorticia sp.]MCI1932992.1 SDR family oxidoreductase [Ancrocorticia sp.]MCI1963329.1 SDR family oxidoreductase [Ancrocorticia sp.]MCI2002822.1 SDR family oxidoreductase [Ancrocorticia sp.]
MVKVLVTGASTGIGRATAVRLAREGFDVYATARRADRLERLAQQIGCKIFPADLTKDDDVAALAAFVEADGPLQALVNNAGGAEGQDPVASGDVAQWRSMYEKNVLGTLRLTQAVLPSMRKLGGDLVFVTSTAAHETYVGGAGYTAAKHAELMIPQTLRIELVGEPVRIIEVAPGMVKTEEFSLNRLGNKEAAEKVYAGVAEPLVADDIADVIAWALTRPSHVNIDSVVVRPRAQANSWTVARQ